MTRVQLYMSINRRLIEYGIGERAEDYPEKWEQHYQDFSLSF